MRKHLFWVVPLSLAGIAALAGLLALPVYVSAPAHRAKIEGFASQLTGRSVRISGKLSLSYLPRPEITATGITITGPDNDIIAAKALSLDLSLATFLHGQFGAQTLRLESPVISFPWPILNGINDIAPPPWLATLHAQIHHGQIRLGAADFTDVDADLKTGTGGSVQISGKGNLQQIPLGFDLSIGQTASIGGTPFFAHASLLGISANLKGSFDPKSVLTGQLQLNAPNNITGQAQLQLDANTFNVSSLKLQQGSATLDGSAQLALQPLELTADLSAQNINLNNLNNLNALVALLPEKLTVKANLNISKVIIAGQSFPSLHVDFVNDNQGEAFNNLLLNAQGASSLKGNILLAQNGDLSGHLDFTAPDLTNLLFELGISPDTDWQTATLHADLQGTRQTPKLSNISGTLGNDHVGGNIIFSAHHAAFQLKFDHLALLKLAPPLQKTLSGADGSFTAEGELLVGQAEAGAAKLNNLFIDADLNQKLNIRRLTANLYGGIAGGNLVLDKHFSILSAHLFLNLPAATPLLQALAPNLKLPQALLAQPLTMTAVTSGAPSSMSAAAVIKLGSFTFTTTPQINLTQSSAEGAISLRTPDAISAFNTLGLVNGCSRMAALPGYPFQPSAQQPCLAQANNPGLAFPGPGSLSLDAHFTVAPKSYALTDFILSAGRLNASGRLSLQNGQLNGQISASTLALPALLATTTINEKPSISGQIKLSADQVTYAGERLFGPSEADLTITPQDISLSKLKASFGNSSITGDINLKLPESAPPALSANFVLADIDASTIKLKQAFPFRLTSGQLDATVNLKAFGYTLQTWAATLSGDAALKAQNGEIEGISLPGVIMALAIAKPLDTSFSMAHGKTTFTTLLVNATISQGNCTLTQAKLSSHSGNISAFGGIDLFDKSLALRVEATPALHPALTLTTRLIGPWAQPSQTTDTSPALAWHPAQASHYPP